MRCFLILALLFGVLVPANAFGSGGNSANDSFAQAKKMLRDKVYFDHRRTIYCDAAFDEHGKVDLPQGFTTPSHHGRSGRIEWEHAVPAENFGRAFSEWRDGSPDCVDNRGNPFKGRKCAEKVNMEYRYMQSDMHNLFPAIGSVNAVRSNFQYSELGNEPSSFGTCQAKLSDRRFEPPKQAKGELARAALYMDMTYPKYSLSRQQRQLFEAWDKMYPVTKWECVRSKRISKLQGNDNPVVKQQCEKYGLWN